MDQQLLAAIIEYILRNYDIEPDGTLSELLKEYDQQRQQSL